MDDFNPPSLRIGLLTDIHYADLPPTDSRDTRASLQRLRQAVDTFNREAVDLVVCLGDLIDSGPDDAAELSFLNTIIAELQRVICPIYYCLGNHCVDRLSKDQVLRVLNQPAATFDVTRNGIRLLGLDTCFNPDGSSYGELNSDWRIAALPSDAIEQLDQQLNQSSAPTILFSHHRIDASDDWSLRNAPELRLTLEKHPHVSLIVQGHAHRGQHHLISSKHYVTLEPMIWPAAESNAFSILTLPANRSAYLHGFFAQASLTISTDEFDKVHLNDMR